MACKTELETDLSLENRFDSLLNLIGRTPLLAIHLNWRGSNRIIYAKAEHYSLTGSIKDRMAYNILRSASETGVLRPGDVIAEATSGNAGIAIAAIGRALGHTVCIYMPDWMSSERKSLLRSIGADLYLVSEEEGGFLGSIAATENLAREREDIFLPCQFSNKDNCGAHEIETGREILKQLDFVGKTPDGFVAGVGTGGTIMGVGRALRAANPDVVIHPLEPSESPTLTTGYKVGTHRIQGISDEFIPSIVKLDEVDEVVAVSDGDSILMAQKLAADLGLAVGISSGANFLGALMAQDKLGTGAIVATVFADDNKKYLSTDLGRNENVKPEYISPDVELIGFEAIPCFM